MIIALLGLITGFLRYGEGWREMRHEDMETRSRRGEKWERKRVEKEGGGGRGIEGQEGGGSSGGGRRNWGSGNPADP